MSRYDELHEEAYSLYRANRHTEAALLFRQAAADALEIGNRVSWYTNMVWMIVSKVNEGDFTTALNYLLEARSHEPEDAPSNEVWRSRKKQYEILAKINPKRLQLEVILEDLHTYSRSHSIPISDLHQIKADLLKRVGDWSKALAEYEVSWQTYEDGGYFKSMIAFDASLMAMNLGCFNVSRDWIEELKTIDHKDEKDSAQVKVWETQLPVLLGLAEGYSFPDLSLLLRNYKEAAYGGHAREVSDELRELTVRVHLINHKADPADRFNPAYVALCRRLLSRNNVHKYFEGRLLFLDYRLATLRFITGIPPVDDLYYCYPQSQAQSATPERFELIRNRLLRVRQAVRWALVYARYVDQMLECDWRQQEVQKRVERINEIARNSLPNDSHLHFGQTEF